MILRVPVELFVPLLDPIDLLALSYTCKKLLRARSFVYRKWRENLFRRIDFEVPKHFTLYGHAVVAAFAPYVGDGYNKVQMFCATYKECYTFTEGYSCTWYSSSAWNAKFVLNYEYLPYWPIDAKYKDGKFVICPETIIGLMNRRIFQGFYDDNITYYIDRVTFVYHYDVISSKDAAKIYLWLFDRFKSRKVLENGIIECII